MQVTYPGTAGPTPYGFIGNWFRCHAIFDPHWFCDPHLDAAIQKANTVEVTNIPAARVLWARIDRELVDRAAWVPLVNPHWIDFVSRRVHNYEADPNVGLIADQVWLR